MSPDGRTLAMIETTEANGAAVTLRDERDGHIIRTIDPCEACRYSDPIFGPDGTVAFLMRAGDVTRLDTVKGNQANTVAPRSAARREGQEWVNTCRSRWEPFQ